MLNPKLSGAAVTLLAIHASIVAAQAIPHPRVQRSTTVVHEGSGLRARLSPDGRRVALNLLGSIYVADRATGLAKPVTDPKADPREYGEIAWAPDSRHLLLLPGDLNFAGVALVDVETGGRTQVTRRADLSSIDFTPNGDIVALAPSGDSIEVRRYPAVADARAARITMLPRASAEAHLAPDGTKLLYVTATNSRGLPTAQSVLVERDITSGAEREIGHAGSMDCMPTYSPDGATIAFLSERSGTRQLWTMPSSGTGSDARAITKDVDDVLQTPLSWTADSRAVGYVAHGRFFLAPIDGSAPAEIPFTATFDVARWTGLRRPDLPPPGSVKRVRGIADPNLSPDGKRAVFTALGDLWSISVNGGTPTRLTNTPLRDEYLPRWSPDGKRVAYSANEPGKLDHWRVLDTSSGEDVNLPDSASGPFVAWSHDGRRLAFAGGPGVGWIQLSDRTIHTAARAPISSFAGFTAGDDSLVYTVASTPQYDTLGHMSFRHDYVVVAARDSAVAAPWRKDALPGALDAAWTADLSRAAYTSASIGYWTSLRDGGKPVRIADPTPKSMSWSANGRELLYGSRGRLRLLDVASGRARTIDVAISYRVAAASAPLVIRGVHLIDGRGTPRTDRRDVVVRNGRIAQITAAGAAHVPPHARVIEGFGKTLMPGLFDNHVHLFRSPPSMAYLHYGVTSIRDVGTRGEWTQAQREVGESGTVPMPRLFFSAGRLTAAYDLGDREDGLRTIEVTDEPAAIAEGIETFRALGADVLKVYFRNFAFDAHASEATHRLGLPMTSHYLTPGSVARGLEGKEHSHLYILPEGWTTPWREDAIALAKSGGVCVTPTLGTFLDRTGGKAQVFSFDLLTMYDDSASQLFNPTLPPSVRTFLTQPLSPVTLATWERRFVEAIKNVGRMRAAGIRIASGTDFGAPGSALLIELELLVKAGLTPLEAIRAATYDAATCVGVEQSLGSIEIGKLADLVLVDGDPSQRIQDAARVSLVVVGGRAWTRRELAAIVSRKR